MNLKDVKKRLNELTKEKDAIQKNVSNLKKVITNLENEKDRLATVYGKEIAEYPIGMRIQWKDGVIEELSRVELYDCDIEDNATLKEIRNEINYVFSRVPHKRSSCYLSARNIKRYLDEGKFKICTEDEKPTPMKNTIKAVRALESDSNLEHKVLLLKNKSEGFIAYFRHWKDLVKDCLENKEHPCYFKRNGRYGEWRLHYYDNGYYHDIHANNVEFIADGVKILELLV